MKINFIQIPPGSDCYRNALDLGACLIAFESDVICCELIEISDAFVKNELGSCELGSLDKFFYDIDMSVIDVSISDDVNELANFKT